MTAEINHLKEPDLKNPVAVAGLPGIALIGKLSIEYLIDQFEAEKFAEMKSDKFPGWAVRENGIVRELKVNFYEAHPEGSDQDFLLLTADAQASSSHGQHVLSKDIVDFLAEQDAETVLTMAAFLQSEEQKDPVVGAATDLETAEMIGSHGVELLGGGRIVGMNGLLVTMASEEDMNGFCLLGTTKDKSTDPDAAQEVLSMFSNIYDLGLDLSDFEDKVPELPKFKPPEIKMPSVSGEERELSYIG